MQKIHLLALLLIALPLNAFALWRCESGNALSGRNEPISWGAADTKSQEAWDSNALCREETAELNAPYGRCNRSNICYATPVDLKTCKVLPCFPVKGNGRNPIGPRQPGDTPSAIGLGSGSTCYNGGGCTCYNGARIRFGQACR